MGAAQRDALTAPPGTASSADADRAPASPCQVELGYDVLARLRPAPRQAGTKSGTADRRRDRAARPAPRFHFMLRRRAHARDLGTCAAGARSAAAGDRLRR